MFQERFIYVGEGVWLTKVLWDTLYGNFIVVDKDLSKTLHKRIPSATLFAKNYINEEMYPTEMLNVWTTSTKVNPVTAVHVGVIERKSVR